jgi:hypothetical protein
MLMMQAETALFDSHGIIVLAREIITPAQTIPFGDIQDVRIQRSSSSAVDWCAVGLLLILAGTAFVYSLVGWSQGAQPLFCLGAVFGVALTAGIPLLVFLRMKALVVVLPGKVLPLAYARSSSALDPLRQAILSAVWPVDGQRPRPRWGSALQNASKQSDSKS